MYKKMIVAGIDRYNNNVIWKRIKYIDLGIEIISFIEVGRFGTTPN